MTPRAQRAVEKAAEGLVVLYKRDYHANPSALERFNLMMMPEPNSGCWLWVASIKEDGYAQICINGRTRIAHRWAYEQMVGPVPPGLQLDHKCHVRCCVNPDHLTPATPQENTARALAHSKGKPWQRKTHCKRGHELSEHNVIIRESGAKWCRVCGRYRRTKAYFKERALMASELREGAGR
jgi:hypothetical protein